MKGRRRIGIAVIGLVVLFALAQLVRPARTNPPDDPQLRLETHIRVDPAVVAVIDRSCADCHSNRTRWPGYSKVAPVSWLVAHDVNDGRRELNVSEWGTYSAAREQKKLARMCKEVRDGDMPPFYYVWMHANAKLAPADVDLLCQWTDSARAALAGSTPPAAPTSSLLPAAAGSPGP